MSSCTITGTLYAPDGSKLASSPVAFAVITDGAARASEHIPYKVQSEFTTDADGLLTAVIEAPSSGSWQYRMTIKDNSATYDFYLAAGTTDLTIDEVLALAGLAGSDAGTPQANMLLGIYTDAQTATDGQLLTADGAGGVAWENAPETGIADATSDGNVYGRQDAAWVDLAGEFDALGAANTAVSGHESTYDHGNIPSADEAAWVTAGKTTVPDGSTLESTTGSQAKADAAQAAAQSYADGLDIVMDGRVDILEAALIPVAVADMTATANGSTAIDLAWTYTAVAPIAGFRIYRKTGAGGSYALIDTANSEDTSYADSGLSQSTEYYYRVDAYNTLGAGTLFQTLGNEDNATTETSVEINTTLNAGAITPTFGSELVANGDMELDSSWINYTSPVTNERSSEQAHGGTYSRKLVGDSNGDGMYQLVPVTNGIWYRLIGWAYVAAGNARVQTSAAQLNLISGLLSTASWIQSTMIGRAISTANATLTMLQSGAIATTAYFDDISIKAMTFSTALTLLGDILRSTGTWRCTPTVAAGTQAGLAINYTDANNLVLAYVNRYDGKAYLDKRIAGTWTNVINGAITYGAGKELAVVVNGTTYQLFYDGVQVGTDQTIGDSLGTAVYGFTTDSTNAVGAVATDPATTYAPA